MIQEDCKLILNQETTVAMQVALYKSLYGSSCTTDAVPLRPLSVLGCPTLAPPRNSWVKHSGDSVAVYCNSSKKEWHLRCSGNSWIGEVGVCDGG